MNMTVKMISLFTLAGIGLSGCAKKTAGGPPADSRGAMPPPMVKTVETHLEPANPATEYIAHVEPIQQVKLTAQVEGTIEEVHFKEGSRVKEGDLLFTINPGSYEAVVAQRKAEREQAKASVDRSEKYLNMLSAADNRSVSKSDRDTAETNVAADRAMLHKAEAALRLAEIDLGYTRITSPIDGRIGRALITRGNLVSPSAGPLATVIQIDPIRSEWYSPCPTQSISPHSVNLPKTTTSCHKQLYG